MILYAIRDTNTGWYMPASKRRVGFTSDEPIKDCIPRLFKRKSDAQCALNHWKRGITTTDSYFASHIGPLDCNINTTKQPHRSTMNMEIITIWWKEMIPTMKG